MGRLEQIGLLLVLVAVAKASFFNHLSRALRGGPRPNECGADPSAREPCGRRYNGIGKWECKARGCCYDDRDRVEDGTILCYLPRRMLDRKCAVAREDKDDCGYYDIQEGECLSIGCCFKPSPNINDPLCFYPLKGDFIDIRLMDHDTENNKQGRVEVYYEEEWGTICDDGFGKEEADVICKMNGYASGVPKIEAYFGQGSDKIWLDSMGCTGDESNIGMCEHEPWGQHDCSHSEDAGVICYNAGEEPEPTEFPGSGGYGYYGDDDDHYWDNYEYQSRLKVKPKRRRRI